MTMFDHGGSVRPVDKLRKAREVSNYTLRGLNGEEEYTVRHVFVCVRVCAEVSKHVLRGVTCENVLEV